MDHEIAETILLNDPGLRPSFETVAGVSPTHPNYIGHIESLAVMIALRYAWADEMDWDEIEALADRVAQTVALYGIPGPLANLMAN